MWSLMCADSRRALLLWLTWLEAAVDHTAELQVKAAKTTCRVNKNNEKSSINQDIKMCVFLVTS